MKQLIGNLIERLVRKGMEVTSIPAYIRDLGNTIEGSGYASLQDLNRHLRLLGWDDFDLDDQTLQLIIATFENEFTDRPSYLIEKTFNPGRLYEENDEKPANSESSGRQR
jgi:hypothetical protein